MAKATLTLRTGTTVVVEGALEEVRRLLAFYDAPEGAGPTRGSARSKEPQEEHIEKPRTTRPEKAMVHEIANVANACSDASAIASRILDSRSQLNRSLLPLYIVSQHLGGEYPLTMSQISQVTRQLGSLVEPTNVAKVMRTTGARFVMAEGSRNAAEPRRYKLSRRGVEHVKAVLEGAAQARRG